MSTMQQTDPHTGAPIGEPVELDLPTQDMDAVHALGDVVRLHEYVGSQAKQKIIYRIVRLPDPKARRKAERDCYAAEPITGGQNVIAENWMLVPGSAADKAKADATPTAAKPVLGMVVTTTVRLKGMHSGDRLIVTNIRDAKVSLTVLDSDGRTWTGVPVTHITRVDL